MSSHSSDCQETFADPKQIASNKISKDLLILYQGLYHALLQTNITSRFSKIKKTFQTILHHNLNLRSDGFYQVLRSKHPTPTIEQVYGASQNIQFTLNKKDHTKYFLTLKSDQGVIPRDVLRSLKRLLKQLPEDSPYYHAFEPFRRTAYIQNYIYTFENSTAER